MVAVGAIFPTTFLPKEPSVIIFTNGGVPDSWTPFMMRCESRYVSRRVASQRPARAASIRRVSNPHEPPTHEGLMRGKKINGVKRHIAVDTLGLLLVVVVHSAAIQDRDGAKMVFDRLGNRFPRLHLIWADGGYGGKLIEYVYYWYLLVLEIVKRSEDQKGFKILPRRWVVERTFGWLMNYRRLCRNYERWTETSETLVKMAMIHIMLRRIA